jgi:hypothetical protein
VSALTPFVRLDRAIAERGISRRTLDPTRSEALGFEEIAVALAFEQRDPRVVEAVAELARELVEAIAEHFPENLFADYGALVEACVVAAERSSTPLEVVRETGRALVDLQALFGRHSTVRFRYVHDFLYGYDWAKWVQREPAARATVDAYAPAFLTAMLARGREMLALIANDDRTYPRLRDDRPRNPFRFDREPASEEAIHRMLAARDALPVRAYRLSSVGPARGDWSRAYQELRYEVAASLGLSRP